jgi:phosphoglycolate phosphatase
VTARPEAILFDWDNTLVDGWAAIERGLNDAFDAFGLRRWSREEVLENVRLSLRDSFPRIFGADWERARDIFYAGVRACHLEVLRPLPGTEAMLDAAAPLPLGVVSNKQGPLLRREAEHLGWADRFGAVIGAGDAAADKPSAAPILMALQAMKLRPSPRVWYVGDTAVDMQAARAAGCRAVLLGDAAHDGGVAFCSPDIHLRDAAAMAQLLLSLDNAA